MRNSRMVAIGGVFLVLLVAGMLFVNVRAATSSTSARSTVGTASSTPGGGAGTTGAAGTEGIVDSRDQMLYLYVEGEDALTVEFRRRLLAALEEWPQFFPRVTLLQSPPASDNHPVVVAAIVAQEVTWTPVYSRGNLSVRFAYASDKGDISWRDDGPSVFDGREQAARVRADLVVADETRGLVSRPAYVDHLGQAIAEHVGKELRQALEVVFFLKF